jgi:hypothetical protein
MEPTEGGAWAHDVVVGFRSIAESGGCILRVMRTTRSLERVNKHVRAVVESSLRLRLRLHLTVCAKESFRQSVVSAAKPTAKKASGLRRKATTKERTTRAK